MTQEKPLFKWKLDVMCDNCPFLTNGKAIALHPARLPGIKLALLKGDKFFCHKTTTSTGNGDNLYCAGALDYQEAAGIKTPYMALCRSLEGIRETKHTMFKRLRRMGRRQR